MCLALYVEEPDGEGDLSMLRHSGPKAALPFCDNDHREFPVGPCDCSLVTTCSFFIFLPCQGERGLDGFPGKPGETGEQVGGCWG